MKKFTGLMLGGMLMTSLLSGCGNQEGKGMLEGKTFEANKGSKNEYLLTFRKDGTMQVKENGNLGRTDEGEYKVSKDKNDKGYYEVRFSKLDQHAGYVDKKPAGGYWALDQDKDNNPILRYVDYNCTGMTDDTCTRYIISKEKLPPNNELDDSEDVYLKQK